MHVIATLDRAGAEGQLVRLCLRLDRSAFAPSVCCLTRGGGYEAELRQAGIPVFVLGKRGRWDVFVLFRLVKMMRRERPDIVQTWLFTSNLWGRVAAKLARVPVVIASERAVDRWKTRAHALIDRMLARMSDAVVANAEAVGNFCVNRVGIPPVKISVIRNGLNIEAFDQAASRFPTDPAPLRGEGLIVGIVARLEPQKDIPTLLGAIEIAFTIGGESIISELWIIGDGPDRAKLEAMASSSPTLKNRVRFLGRRDDVPALLKMMDIFVLSSLWEGMPNAVIEAMAAGLPVIATAVDGTTELVDDGSTGLLVSPGSPRPLAVAINNLARDEELRRRMGAAGRERVERVFGEERMVDEFASLYRELANEIDS